MLKVKKKSKREDDKFRSYKAVRIISADIYVYNSSHDGPKTTSSFGVGDIQTWVTTTIVAKPSHQPNNTLGSTHSVSFQLGV